MRDLRIIVIESRAGEAGLDLPRTYFGGEHITDKTRAEKALSKRASLLAAHLGGASDPELVADCRRWIEVCERLGFNVEVDADVASRILGGAR